MGKLRSATAELYYLMVARAETRLRVVTDPAFMQLLHRELEGALDPESNWFTYRCPPVCQRTFTG